MHVRPVARHGPPWQSNSVSSGAAYRALHFRADTHVLPGATDLPCKWLGALGRFGGAWGEVGSWHSRIDGGSKLSLCDTEFLVACWVGDWRL